MSFVSTVACNDSMEVTGAGRKIKCILFDCDNTLVLSERVAFESGAELLNKILEEHDIDKRYCGKELQHEFNGLTFRRQIEELQRRHDFTIPASDVEEYAQQDLKILLANLEKHCEPCEGVIELLEQLSRDNRYILATVSSSAMSRVEASLIRANLKRFFPNRYVFSAFSSLSPPTSKPDPAIYLHACAELGVKPWECVAIEDSRSGAMAATRAGIPLIGYVGTCLDEGGVEKRDEVVATLRDDCGAVSIMHHWADFWKHLADIERTCSEDVLGRRDSLTDI